MVSTEVLTINQLSFAAIQMALDSTNAILIKKKIKTTLANLMKKILLLLVFIVVTATVGAQPPPPPGTGAPIDTDVLYFILPAALFAVYSLNKKRFSPITISKK